MQLGVDPEDMRKVKIVGEASGRALSAGVRVDETALRRADYRLDNLSKLSSLLREKYDDLGGLKPKVIDHEPNR
jgi:hypothetical protein